MNKELSANTNLSHYRIISKIGAGGMGEVYRARDTRLDRIVAIKVLPDHLASHPELRQRLEREDRAVSSVNHPHICTLHDIGHLDVAAEEMTLINTLVSHDRIPLRLGAGGWARFGRVKIYDAKTGVTRQEYVYDVVKAYIDTTLNH